MAYAKTPEPPRRGEHRRVNISWALAEEAMATATLLGHDMGPWIADLFTPHVVDPEDEDRWEDGPYSRESWCSGCRSCGALASLDIRAPVGDRTNGRALYRPCTGV